MVRVWRGHLLFRSLQIVSETIENHQLWFTFELSMNDKGKATEHIATG